MSTDALLQAIVSAGGDPADLPFWQGCQGNRLLLHRCNLCNRHYWPASRCIEHSARDMAWVEASGRGELYTYTIMHRVLAPAFRDKAPYVVAVIKLDEGPFLHSNLLDCALEEIAVGMRVECMMVGNESGLTLPQFRPAAA